MDEDRPITEDERVLLRAQAGEARKALLIFERRIESDRKLARDTRKALDDYDRLLESNTTRRKLYAAGQKVLAKFPPAPIIGRR